MKGRLTDKLPVKVESQTEGGGGGYSRGPG